jgi:hypothetical protein
MGVRLDRWRPQLDPLGRRHSLEHLPRAGATPEVGVADFSFRRNLRMKLERLPFD